MRGGGPDPPPDPPVDPPLQTDNKNLQCCWYFQIKKLWLLPFSDYGWVFSDKYTRNIPIYATLICFCQCSKWIYEPLDGSVVSIDTTLTDGFVSDDLNVSRRPLL